MTGSVMCPAGGGVETRLSQMLGLTGMLPSSCALDGAAPYRTGRQVRPLVQWLGHSLPRASLSLDPPFLFSPILPVTPRAL